MTQLAGKVAIVTGAGRGDPLGPRKPGIGAAVGKRLAEEGARVVLVDVTRPMEEYPGYVPATKDELERTVRHFQEQGYEAIGVAADVGKADDVERVMQSALERFGRIDILVNNAGACILQPMMDMDERVFDLSYRVMVKGSFLCSKSAARVMTDQGEGGRIIQISSILGKVGSLFCGAYSAAKAAIIGMSRVMAQEWAPQGINVNVVCPGYIQTHILEGEDGVFETGARLLGIDSEKEKRILLNQTPKARFGRPTDVADVACFLASKESEFITGQAINVDGGVVMY